MKKFLLILFTSITVCAISTAQQTFPVNGVTNNSHLVYAFTNARIVVDPETIIEKGNLIIKDGLIAGVGEKVEIPNGALVYDLKGKTIYPGLIDPYTHYGITDIKAGARGQYPQMESTTKGAYGWNQAVKPEVEAYKLFTNNDKSAEELRKMGFGAVLTFRNDGIVRGSAAVVSLGVGRENELMIRDKAAAMYSFDKGTSTQDYPSSLMGAIALLRQTYLDAEWYNKDKTKKEYNISLEMLNNLLELPQIIEATDKLSALRADRIGDEFKLNYIIKGSGNEYQRLDEIKASNCKYILPLNFPAAYDVEDAYDAMNVSLAELKHWEMAPANPFAFEKYFIPFAFTTSDLKDKKDFYKNIRKAISFGLTEKQALKALTVIPAEMLNVADKIGRLKTGMVANFIITNGNLFDEKIIIYENWIQGNQYRISDYNLLDVRGKYDFSYGNKNKIQLNVEGEQPDKLKATLVADTVKTPVTITVLGNVVSLSFSSKDSSGSLRMSGNISAEPLKMSGKGQGNNGEWISWNALFKSAIIAETKKDTAQKETPAAGQVIYPFCAYGKKQDDRNGFDKIVNDFKNRYDAILIKDVTVWTNEKEGVLKNQDVYITEGRIVRIADDIGVPKLAFAKIIDGAGKHLTPGIIDEHSHIAISNGVNEGAEASSAEVRIGDVINSEDINIYRQLSGGVTAAQLLHGSANPIGGQSAIIKLRWGKSP